jgi:hypothetical protein
MNMKKRKTGPRAEIYNTRLDQDAATRKDKYPSLRNKAGELSIDAWVTDEVAPHKDLSSTVKSLVLTQGRRLSETTFFMSLYANCDFMQPFNAGQSAGIGGFASAVDATSQMPRMSNNLLRVCTDSLAGKLIQSNSRVVMSTRMGDFSLWQKARKMELAIEGEFAKMKLYKEVKQVAVDAINSGDGFLKLYPDYDGKGICCERVFPNEVFVDELEAAYGAPTKMYQLRYARKENIMAWYPDKAEIIKKAGTTIPPRFGWTLYQPGMVEIYEGWALPVGNRPGRHIIAVSSGVLFEEPWNHPFFPIIRFKAGDRPFGWYGAGYTEQVAATQIDLNKTLTIMQKAAQLGIAPYWVVPEGSNINLDHLTNRSGHIVATSGAAPVWSTNQPFHPAAVQYIEMLKAMIQQFFGMNEMETTGQLPVNRLDSEPALREFQDMGTARHTILLERWQEFFVEVGERVLMLGQDIAKKNGSYPVMAKKGYGRAMSLDWSDLSIANDSYLMNCAPSNILPMTTAGKVQKIQELKTDGLISPAMAARASMGPADIQAIMNEVSADEDDIDRLIEQLSEKEYREPSTLQNLPRALERVTSARLEFANLGATDDVLRYFDKYLADAKSLTTMMQNQLAGVLNGTPQSAPNAPGQPLAAAPSQPTAGSQPAAAPGAPAAA